MFKKAKANFEGIDIFMITDEGVKTNLAQKYFTLQNVSFPEAEKLHESGEAYLAFSFMPIGEWYHFDHYYKPEHTSNIREFLVANGIEGERAKKIAVAITSYDWWNCTNFVE